MSLSSPGSLVSGRTQITSTYLAVFVFSLFAVALALVMIPGGVTRANLQGLAFDTPFLHWLGNVALIALTVAITGLALASITGYALSRFHLFRRSTSVGSGLITQILPAAVLLLPLYLILIRLGLIKSALGVIIIYLVTTLPFCLWQMKRYYDGIPLSLEEAASLDGASRWQSFRLIILPLAAPALFISALFSFMIAWNEYIIAAVVLQDVRTLSLPLGVKMLNAGTQWTLYSTGAILISIPMMVLFLVLSRLLVSGQSFGPVKE